VHHKVMRRKVQCEMHACVGSGIEYVMHVCYIIEVLHISFASLRRLALGAIEFVVHQENFCNYRFNS